MIHDLCGAFLFNNPGKIKEACFDIGSYSNPIANPCTSALWEMGLALLADRLGIGAAPAESAHYNDSTGGAGIDSSGDSSPQPSLADLLPSEYKSSETMTLSDVVE
jgi:hypothetical protein